MAGRGGCWSLFGLFIVIVITIGLDWAGSCAIGDVGECYLHDGGWRLCCGVCEGFSFLELEVVGIVIFLVVK